MKENTHVKGEIIMYIYEVEKRNDYTITTIYQAKDYLKEKGFKNTIKAIVKQSRGK